MTISPLLFTLSLSGLIFIFYLIQRILFILWNWTHFSNATFFDLLNIGLQGARFDLYSIVVLNLIPLLLSLASHRKYYKKQILFVGVLIILSNLPFLILNQIDIEFVNFLNRRINTGSFSILSEAQGKLSGFLETYLPLILLQILILVFILFLFYKITLFFLKNNLTTEKKYYVILLIALIPFWGVFMRGGFQRKPLNSLHAIQYNDSHMNMAILNTTFTMLRDKPATFVKSRGDFRDFTELQPFLNGFTQSDSLWKFDLKKNKTNVVVIILESFAQEYMGEVNNQKGYSPFLDQLAKNGIFMKNSFSNGSRSIEAISSILAGIPSLMLVPFVRTPYFNNEVRGLGTYFKKIGYQTSFFHGGFPGTMFFDVFTQKAGFEKYYSSEDHPNPKDTDGIWGIYDEPFLQFMIQEIDKYKKPFLNVFFSLTSHHPYPIPQNYRDTLPEGEHPILKSIAYTDMALKKFFKEASRKSWYENTLFIITADHTQHNILKEYEHGVHKYRIPIIFYHPKMKLPDVNTNRPTQHVDILPTLLDMFKIEDQNKILFGKSIFNPDSSYVTLLDDKVFMYYDNQHLVRYTRDDRFEFYDGKDQAMTHKLEYSDDNSLKKLRATLQYFNNGMLNNSLYNKKN